MGGWGGGVGSCGGGGGRWGSGWVGEAGPVGRGGDVVRGGGGRGAAVGRLFAHTTVRLILTNELQLLDALSLNSIGTKSAISTSPHSRLLNHSA